jgi:hypothetical protein
MIIYGLFHPKIYGMTKMPKMKKNPNLLLFIGRDHQMVYLAMLSPINNSQKSTFLINMLGVANYKAYNIQFY